jgi:hypothetical protein
MTGVLSKVMPKKAAMQRDKNLRTMCEGLREGVVVGWFR